MASYSKLKNPEGLTSGLSVAALLQFPDLDIAEPDLIAMVLQ